ncbi:MAG: hypothetical protein OXN89_20300 [Bryobacterales bacterium]|nr:hypothetical protein [Bryobacterales bacterium]
MPWTSQRPFEARERIAVEVGNLSVRSLHVTARRVRVGRSGEVGHAQRE